MINLKDYLKTERMIYDSYFNKFIYSDEFEDYLIDLITEGCDISDMKFYCTNCVQKPDLTFDDLEELSSQYDYIGDDFIVIEEDKEALDKINNLYHSLLKTLYEPTDELIYIDEQYLIKK